MALPAVGDAAFPRPTGFVNDFAGIMDPAMRERLDGFLASFDAQTGVEVAVATLPSLEGRSVEDVAVDLFRQWGIGRKGKDDGLLFLVAPAERKMRVEVGYGLEGAMNDALAGRILDEEVLPRFKAGRMGDGIAAGTIALVSTIAQKEGLPFDMRAALSGVGQAPQQKRDGPLSTALKILFILFMIVLFFRHPWLFLFFLSSGGGRGGGGFGGGFGGFGGGLSGGGGASRGW